MFMTFKTIAVRLRQKAAFTLVEVMIAVAILGIMFVALYGGMSSGFAVTQLARENLRATQIMLERMEGIRLYNWEQVVYSNMVPTTFVAHYYPLASNG
jgi:prepilin-type N-terminal cleavage/methylation domain-containing protein